MAHLLLIDDDPALIPKQVRLAFPEPMHRVEVAGSGVEGLGRVRTDPPDVILLDLRLPDQSGLEAYQAIRRIDARIPVIFITLARSADAAIEAMRQGACDYLFKPLGLDQLRRVVGEVLEVGRRMRQPAAVAEDLTDPDLEGAIVGSCAAMREAYKVIGLVSDQDVPVLIVGESGTGKELVARAIYQHGKRARAPYRALNCAAIPEGLLESELFGHEKGAFTGADRRRIGKFEQCNGGTIFLDEIGDMAPASQAKILRLLQEQEFDRVGGNETVRTDVRLIAATHRDLKAWSAEGRFRPDLYYRLGVVTIHVPPLRERGDDLLLLVQRFLRRFNRELGRDVREVAPAAMDRLRSYSWPGNVRGASERPPAGPAPGHRLDLAHLPPARRPARKYTGEQGVGRSPHGRDAGRTGAQGNPGVSDPDRWEPAAGRRTVGDQHSHPAAQDPRVQAGGSVAPGRVAQRIASSLERLVPTPHRSRPGFPGAFGPTWVGGSRGDNLSVVPE